MFRYLWIKEKSTWFRVLIRTEFSINRKGHSKNIWLYRETVIKGNIYIKAFKIP